MRHLDRWADRAFARVAAIVAVCAMVVVSAASQEPAKSADGGLIGNKALKSYHRPDCPLLKRLTSKNKVEFGDGASAVSAGYRACSQCKPDEGVAADGDTKPKEETPAKPSAAEPSDGKLRFSRDIAPILAANCMGCHRANPKRGEFDLSTFEGMTKGSKSGPVIVPGKPEESLLVELVVERKMPRGNNNRRLSDEAIAKIQQWVKEGAVLDQGISPSETLDKISPTAEQTRQEAMARLSPEQRDKKLEDAALERYRRAGAKQMPTATSGRGFVFFGTFSEDRAKDVLRSLDAQRAAILNLFGQTTPIVSGVEKISLYTFNDAASYAEFVRSVEQREVEPGVAAHARLNVESPYLAAVDPLRGASEAPEARTNSRSRKKAAEDSADEGPDRSLAGLFAEQLGSGVLVAAGACPRWLSDGFGTFVASQVEPRSAYFQGLRRETSQQLRLGWNTKVTEVLGDEGRPEVIRAVGFSLCEWMSSDPQMRPRMPYFLSGIASQGGAKLDDVLRECFGNMATRGEFLSLWEQYVSSRSLSTRRR